MNSYLGIDLGTSSLKIILVNQHGETIASKTKSYPLITNKPGWIEQNPNDWTDALQSAFNELKQESADVFQGIKAISVTGQMHGIIPVDKNRDPLYSAIIWSDQRNEQELHDLMNLYSLETWVEMTGNRPSISFTLGKILWFERHCSEFANQVEKYLLPKDYIRMKLTGVFNTDYSDASATNLMDISNGIWSEEIVQKTSIKLATLPPIIQSTDLAGHVTEEASKLYGLPEGIPVICGCGDAQAQAIGNGIVDESVWQCNIGTSGQVIVNTDQCKIEKAGKLHTFSYGTPERWLLMGATLSAGMSMQWLREQVYMGETSITDLLDSAKKVKPGSEGLIFLPYLFGERTPYMDEKAKGSFIGLTYRHTKAEIVCSVVEGVLMSLYQSYELITETIGQKPDTIVLAGGAAQHDLWLQTAANIFNCKVGRKTSRGGAAYGAAMIAATGIGDFKSLLDVSDAWGLNQFEKVVYPEPGGHEPYENLYPIFKKSYSALKGIFHDLHDITLM